MGGIDEADENSFKSFSGAEQVDEIIMKYIFSRPEKPDTFR